MSRTGWFILITTTVVISIVAVYDVWTIENYGVESSISWLIAVSSYQRPLIPALIGFAVGILFGHFWWQLITPPLTVATRVLFRSKDQGLK
jgi:hypothetical protein